MLLMPRRGEKLLKAADQWIESKCNKPEQKKDINLLLVTSIKSGFVVVQCPIGVWPLTPCSWIGWNLCHLCRWTSYEGLISDLPSCGVPHGLCSQTRVAKSNGLFLMCLLGAVDLRPDDESLQTLQQLISSEIRTIVAHLPLEGLVEVHSEGEAFRYFCA